MTHSVELEAQVEPRFPARCIVCARDRPDESAELRAIFNGMKPLREELIKVHRARLPVCVGCKGQLQRSRWLGKLARGLALVVSVALVLGLVSLELTWLQGWVGYAVMGLVLVGPFLAATMAYSAIFDLAPWSTRVVYDFRDRAYAEEFAELNGGRVR